MENSVAILIYSRLNTLERNNYNLEIVTGKERGWKLGCNLEGECGNHINRRPGWNTEEENAGQF